MEIKLINEEKISIEDVLAFLEKQKKGTIWAQKSNDWAIDRAKKFSEINNGNWFKGLLPLKFLETILLPEHVHKNEDNEKFAPFIIPENTPVSKVLSIYKNRTPQEDSECLQNIDDLKERIKTLSFTDEIVLGVKDRNLYHIDGLHRIIALILLLDEGMSYSPIRVCLTRPS